MRYLELVDHSIHRQTESTWFPVETSLELIDVDAQNRMVLGAIERVPYLEDIPGLRRLSLLRTISIGAPGQLDPASRMVGTRTRGKRPGIESHP